MEPFDLTKFGGRAVYPIRATAAGDTQVEPGFNFGVVPETSAVTEMIRSTPDLYTRFPAVQGAWDRSTTVNHWIPVANVLGADKLDSLIQYQPRGTCGGRAGKLTMEMLQCILIAKGMRANFKRVSHAFLYWQARKMYGMAKGRPDDDNNDGVASGSIPDVLSKIGVDTSEETGDEAYYGPGSDDLATRWGCGQIDPALAKKLEGLATDNIVTGWAPVRSAQELADGIAAGGVGIGSDSQGFTTSRDGQGYCSPRGTWQHYQVRGSVIGGSRPGFGYCQSWGKANPTGPQLPGHPSNCFGVDFDVQDRIIKSGRWAIVFGFPLWDVEKLVDIPWTF